MVVEDQARPLLRKREREERRRHRGLGEAAERTERRHAIADLEIRSPAAPGGDAAYDAGDLAAGHERQRRFDLIFAASLQQLGERDPRGVHLDDDAPVRTQHMGGLGLWQVDQLECAVGAGEVDDLDSFHGENPTVRLGSSFGDALPMGDP